ncbi:dephospho-CoA kinase [Microbulbifer flavimaris]|uniref:Dephospho-CoA kinase n=1 Tax=Microbulbifer flavimaris TaxID=1781068 RepID=A0ABX4I1C3_9GAMM|nr:MULTISPECIES: dephospho-CoA kinase [Microbulbifer]KUJ84146.1 dephospho-CoA kinase [Microbulbifer sp. ZGT114]PCO06219.1 dephospho-CoA kinase [Microbulbifer flavimaris]
MANYIVGLTGGIGSGKSAAADGFREHGITVVDADWAARVVVQPGRPALEQIAEHFGADVLLESGELDRARLRQLVFESETERRWLEGLLHPLIREEIVQALQSASSPYAILESPLLIESGQDTLVERVCVVDVPEEMQIARASSRDRNDPEQIRQIMDAQLPRMERLKRADDVLDNSGDLASLRAQVHTLHEHYLQLANKHD